MPRLINVETGQPILEQLELANTWWSRFRGLMLRRELPHSTGLLIEPCTSVHMMWMLFPIDAVWLDSDQRVVKVSRGIPPWVGAARGGAGARAVVEMRRGVAAQVEPGQRLVIEA